MQLTIYLYKYNKKKQKTMKMETKAFVKYEKPQVELLSCCVERGFFGSATLDDMKEEIGDWD